VASAKTRLSSGLVRASLGTLAGVSVFVTGLVLDPVLSILSPHRWVEGQIDVRFAYAALALVVIGLSILFTSATAILMTGLGSETNESRASVFSTLRMIFSEGIYSRVLLLSAVVYSFFYALASGIIVYNPSVNFSTVYHASIPSLAVATCCSPLGQTPLASVYLTEHVGLLLVPVNLLLLFSISWLVGLNVAFGVFVLRLRIDNRRIGWFGGIGAMAGLFTSCPTCAGLAIFSTLGGAGALSSALLLGPLQTLFLSLTLPMLVATPILSARSIRSLESRACNTC
jgi:hypothetical protein